MNENNALKLLGTGWQSWSYSEKSFIQVPQCLYAPKKYKELPKIKLVSNRRNFKKPAYGWCSWYSYGLDINAQKIIQNAKWMKAHKEIPLDYVLIDEGWCKRGDWTTPYPDRFPMGMKHLSSEIRKLKLKPGIWLSPFLVDPKSELAQKHPEWLVHNNGEKMEGLRLTPWDNLFPYKKWVINLRNKDAYDYLLKSIDTAVTKWGFKLLKLDFLYSIYFDKRLSIEAADKILSEFLITIRKKYPDVYTIACGCPLVPAVGNVDSMRTGPDTMISPFLGFSPLIKYIDRWFIQKKVVQTVKKRLWTKRFWNIDPDAFVCRESAGLSKAQIDKHLALTQEASGNIFLGDDLTELTKTEIQKYIKPLFSVSH